jgi:Cu2+-exporting ATPase
VAAPVAPLLLEIEGMRCGGCVRAVEQRLLEQPGVHQASVNLLTRTAWVGVDPARAAQLPPEALLPPLQQALAALGFEARLREEGAALPDLRDRLAQRNWWQHWRQLVVALLLLLVSGLGHLALAGQLTWLGPGRFLAAQWFHGLVAGLALAAPGQAILVRGAQAFRAGQPSMDSLVGLGMASAYLASVVGWLWPESGWPCFFNEPVMLLGFVLLGRFLEERARYGTGRALQQLAALQPDTALLVMDQGPPRQVRVGGLRPGDRLQLLPGDRVPVDGVVRQGQSAVDLSGLTGEPMPVQAVPGSPLAAGALNLEAPLELEVSRAGRDSAIARIIHLVEQAQACKAPIQGLADRVAGRFCLGVLLLALATLLFWWLAAPRIWPVLPALQAQGGHAGHGSFGAAAAGPLALGMQLAIAVLVVACPCALGLATPTAIAVGCGRAARAGLLFRGGDAIETASELGAVLFDKTGTLTLGRPRVTALAPLPSSSPERLLQLAASLETSTRHPLAFALVQAARERDLALLPASDCRTEAGQGVCGELDGHPCRVGRLSWVSPCPPPELLAEQERLEGDGATVLAVSWQGRPLGLVAVQDQPRPDAEPLVRQLREQGLGLGLLSGDRRSAVQRLGQRLGFRAAELAWELSPEQKWERILAWREEGGAPVAMVGDGINDAPALAAADLGIAVGTGTEVARETAALVVMGDRLEAIATALRLARSTMAKVRQNLAWAFGYNLLVLPIAAGLLLPGFGILLTPPLAGLLMALSSITVVVNALLLKDG